MSIMNKALSILKLKISPEKFHYFGLSTRTKIHRNKKIWQLKHFEASNQNFLKCFSSVLPVHVLMMLNISRKYVDYIQTPKLVNAITRGAG